MEELLEGDRLNIIIPECCREGWDACPHVVNKQEKRTKTNIGV